jgi:hypothetical protein
MDKPHTENPYTAKPHTENPHTEKPDTENPYTENPDTVKPDTENPFHSNNDLSNNDFNNNYSSNTDSSKNNPTPTPPAGVTHGEAARAGENTKTNSAVKESKVQFAEFVSMTNDEYSSLVTKIGEEGAAWCVEKLDNYKGSTGKKYENDYRTILSWVIVRYKEYLQAQANQPRPATNNFIQHGGQIQTSDKTGDAFEDYVYMKIEEAKRHGTI